MPFLLPPHFSFSIRPVTLILQPAVVIAKLRTWSGEGISVVNDYEG